jgi:hypothetical protein
VLDNSKLGLRIPANLGDQQKVGRKEKGRKEGREEGREGGRERQGGRKKRKRKVSFLINFFKILQSENLKWYL